jgi:hypothetical protein
MKDQGSSDKKASLTRKAWIGMAQDLTQSTKNMTPLHKKYHNQLVGSVSVMHDIYEQTENIGTEHFQQHDLTKQIATAQKLVNMHKDEEGSKYQDTLDALKAAHVVNKKNIAIHKRFMTASKAMVKPFEALDSLLRKLPMGDLLSDMLGIDKLGKRMTEGFLKIIPGFRVKSAPGTPTGVGGPEDKSFEAGMDWNQFQTAFAESREGPTTSEQRSAAYQKYQSGDLSQEAGGGRDTGYPAGYDEGEDWQEGFEDGKAGVKDKSKDATEEAKEKPKKGFFAKLFSPFKAISDKAIFLFRDKFLGGIANIGKGIINILPGPIKKVGGLIGGVIGGAFKLIVKVIKGIVTIIVVGFVAAITIASKILFGMVKSGFAMQKELGIGVGHAISLNVATRDAAAGGFMYGEKMEDSWKRAQDLVTE